MTEDSGRPESAMVVPCTVKLLKLLGVKTRWLPTLQPSEEDWYANLVYGHTCRGAHISPDS